MGIAHVRKGCEMALPIGISFDVCDGKGKKSNVVIHVPSGTGLADIIGFGQEAAVVIQALLAGEICGISASLPITVPAGVAAAVAAVNSDREEGQKYGFSTLQGFNTVVRIPAAKENPVIAGSDLLDQTDVDVAAFIDLMVNGITTVPSGGTGVITPVDSRDEDIVSIRYAREDFKRYGR